MDVGDAVDSHELSGNDIGDVVLIVEDEARFSNLGLVKIVKDERMVKR